MKEQQKKVPRKHAELIKAWADGNVIQALCHECGDWIDCDVPAWNVETCYRIKPEEKPMQEYGLLSAKCSVVVEGYAPLDINADFSK